MRVAGPPSNQASNSKINWQASHLPLLPLKKARRPPGKIRVPSADCEMGYGLSESSGWADACALRERSFCGSDWHAGLICGGVGPEVT